MYNSTNQTGNSYPWYEIYCEDLSPLLGNIQSKKNHSSEEQRIIIFREALTSKQGKTWVLNRLKEQQLRAIYTRNPIEFALSYCLQCNETENAYKTYDLDGFIKLVNSLPKVAPPNDKIITFGDLKEYVERNYDPQQSDNKDNHTLPAITIQIQKDVDNIDKTSSSAESDFIKLYHKHYLNMVTASNSIRFYVSEYIYYVLCAQILEFKEILIQFANNTPSKILEYFDDYNEFSRWTIAGSMAYDKEIENAVHNINDDPLQVSKLLVSSLVKYFPLYGKLQLPVDEVSPLFIHTSKEKDDKTGNVKIKSQRVISLSELRDETSIFESSSNVADKESHLEKLNAIHSLELTDFLGYKIDYNQLYNLLVEHFCCEHIEDHEDIDDGLCLLESKDSLKKNSKSVFLRSVVSGTMDVSRSALLIILAGAKATIESTDLLLAGQHSILKKDILDKERVNSVLNRVGYVDLGDDETPFDLMFRDYFDNHVEEYQTIKYIEDLCEALFQFMDKQIEKYGYSVIMPYEITEITSEKAHASLVKHSKG